MKRILLAITYTDPADSTTWTGIIALSTGESLTISGDRDSANYKDLTDVVTWADAQTGWTARIPSTGAGDAVTASSGDAKAVCLSVVTDQTTGIFTFDETYLHQVEIVETIEYLEANLTGYTAKVFIWPGGSSNETARDKVKTEGLFGARAVASGTYELENLEIYDIYCFTGAYLTAGGASDTVLQRRIDSHLFWAQNQGFITGIYAHAATEISMAQWDVILPRIRQSGINVKTLTDSVDWILAHGTPDGDAEIYTMSLPDVSDFHLMAGSPCIHAGTNLSIPTDIEGRPYHPTTPSMGAYEYEGHGKHREDCDVSK